MVLFVDEVCIRIMLGIGQGIDLGMGNMAKRIKLTVGIPTYKRPRTLRQAVSSVIEQTNLSHSFDLEILISFNASESGSLEAAKELQAQHPGLVRFHLNETNVGFGPNVDNLVRESKGDFVLILSDDDMLEPDALSTLWAILDRHGDVGAIFLGSTPWNTELSAPLDDGIPHSDRTGSIFYANGVDYILNFGYPPFMVSGVVVRQSLWAPARRPEFLKSTNIHTQTILIMLSRCPALISRVPVVRYRTDAQDGGWNWSSDELFPFTFELDLLVGYQAARTVFPKRCVRCIHRHSMTQIAHSIMNVKVSGGKIAYGPLRARLRTLCDRVSLLYWINLGLLRTPACVLRPAFGVVQWLREAIRGNAFKRV